MWLTLLFLLAALLSAALLFTMVYCIIMFSDLEMDYVNPIELCKRLNMLTVPEMAAHFALTVLFMLTLNIVPFLINLPLAAYNAHRFSEKLHPYEPTDVFRQMPYRKRESFAKLAFFLGTFFYYLFRMVGSLID